MAIRMKIPRSNIYLQSGSLFFTKDSFQVSLYTQFALDTEIASSCCSRRFFPRFLSQPVNYCFPKLPVCSAIRLFFSFPPSETENSMRTRADVNARSRGPAFSALESRRLPAIIRARPWKKDCYRPSLTRRWKIRHEPPSVYLGSFRTRLYGLRLDVQLRGIAAVTAKITDTITRPRGRREITNCVRNDRIGRSFGFVPSASFLRLPSFAGSFYEIAFRVSPSDHLRR